ncbi:MAG: hypothetical protein ACKN81_14890, partial [Pirellulaceae bacterium]
MTANDQGGGSLSLLSNQLIHHLAMVATASMRNRWVAPFGIAQSVRNRWVAPFGVGDRWVAPFGVGDRW